jgi:hypothetical protein
LGFFYTDSFICIVHALAVIVRADMRREMSKEMTKQMGKENV